MRSAMNFLLTCLAAGDMVGQLCGASLSIMHQHKKTTECVTKDIEISFYTINASLGVLAGVNSWLTLAIAVTRVVVVRKINFVFSLKKAKLIVLAAFLIPVPIAILDGLVINSYKFSINKTCVMYIIADEVIEQSVLNWCNFVLCLVPCIFLVIFSMLLIFIMFEGKKRHAEITNSAETTSQWDKTNRTTAILLGLTISAFLCRIPFLISVIMIEVISSYPDEFSDCLVHIANILVALNTGLNIVFLAMSGNFRKTLRSIYDGLHVVKQVVTVVTRLHSSAGSTLITSRP